MQQGIFDEAKGVYRVYNQDNSFETYTPAQYRELFGNTPAVEEETLIEDEKEEIVLTEQDLKENPVLAEAGLKVGDVGMVSEHQVDFSEKQPDLSADIIPPVPTPPEPAKTTSGVIGGFVGGIKNVLKK